MAVPCCNMLFGLVWWIASAAIMVKETHKVHGARAALAVFTWPFVSVYLVQVISGLQGILLLTVLMPFALSGFFGPTVGGGMPVSAVTSAVAQAVIGSANQNTGVGPDHALELTPVLCWRCRVATCCLA